MNKLSHIAIIMDGNGRWAQAKGKTRATGHKKGASIVQDITKQAIKENIKYITYYAFSTENWNRPKKEVDSLMNLFEKYLDKEGSFYIKNNVRFNVIGDISKLSIKLQDKISSIMQKTKANTNLVQTLAVNYGSKDEIIRAVNKANKEHKIINEEIIANYLDTHNLPDVDLLIRTGGYKRISNYLLWQIAYAELSFTKTLWPDFSTSEFKKIIKKFKKIKRNFGTLK